MASLFPVRVFADIVVIVHPSMELNTISSEQVANIFLGKTRILPNGKLIVPVDQPRNSDTSREFYSKLISKNESQLNAYWARQVFTGRGQPPIQVNSCNEVKSLIKVNPSMIGYIHGDCADITIKVILTIP
ncbi:phosphate ABC transporter substrate-binding protein [uncultured Oceanicoccus sp.]|uniref:phosphate ABC transporter substrate-binding protein n=1 Tax=uncultured Oceanicoccus sp. TaxID=1706381 RepID=UPI0030D6E417